MSPEKKRQLADLRAMRSRVIGELRAQHNKLKAARKDRSSDPLMYVEDLLLAFVSLAETRERIEQWEARG